MANYHAAIGLHAKDLYGEEVARLQMALTCIGDEFVKSNLRKTTTEFQEWFNNLSEVCSPLPSPLFHTTINVLVTSSVDHYKGYCSSRERKRFDLS